MVAVVKEGKSKIISRSNSGVLTWPTTAAVKISPFELPLLYHAGCQDRKLSIMNATKHVTIYFNYTSSVICVSSTYI